MAVAAEFLDKISCQQSITWSNDHRISISTDAFVRCLTMNCDSTNAENKVGFLQSSIPVESKLLDIPQFSQSYNILMINDLPREEFKIVSTDRVLNPMKYLFDSISHTGYCKVEWSPPISYRLCERSILATLSFDHRLCLFWQKDSLYHWYKICDLTELRINKTRTEIKTLEDYYPYKDWCYSQAVTAMKWYPEVFTESDSGKKFLVLAVGTKFGDVVLWKVSQPCDNEIDCCMLCTIRPNESQIVSLEWCSELGMLIVGNIAGQIHGLHLDLNDLSRTPECTCLYGERSLMKPSSVCLLYNDEDGSCIFVVSMEHCVLAFQLSSDGRKVISQSHLFLENEFPSQGMYPLTNDSVIMISFEAVVQKIVVSSGKEGIQVHSERIPLDLPADAPYVCHGFCLSPNKVFAAFVIRPWPSFDHLDPKFRNVTSTVYIRCVDDLMKGSNCRDSCQKCLMTSPEPMGTWVDILELYRLNILADKNENQNTEDEVFQVSNLRFNQVTRFKKMIQKVKLKTKQKCDEFKDSIEKYENEVYRLSCLISAYWVIESWKNIVSQKISRDNMSDTDRSILSAMLLFLDKHSEILVSDDNVTETRQAVKQFLSGDACVDYFKCCVCNENLELLQSCWKCHNGHLFSICNRTFLPVEGVQYISCQVCHNLVNIMDDCSWLAGDSERCLFCDSMLCP